MLQKPMIPVHLQMQKIKKIAKQNKSLNKSRAGNLLKLKALSNL